MNIFMKQMRLILVLLVVIILQSCKSSNVGDQSATNNQIIEKSFSLDGQKLTMTFQAGKAHNHPTFAIWLESADQQLIQTLFVTKSIATGLYLYGDAGDGKWLKTPGVSIRPAALPVWLHKRENLNKENFSLPTPDSPVPDAYTGATPAKSFTLKAATLNSLPKKFTVYVEVNQPWDWNKYYTNSMFSEESDYKTSAQPSLIYAVDVDTQNPSKVYNLLPIGHGHPSGKDGELTLDLTGFTTALHIFDQITFSFN